MYMERMSSTTGRVKSQWMSTLSKTVEKEVGEGERGTKTRKKGEKKEGERRKKLGGRERGRKEKHSHGIPCWVGEGRQVSVHCKSLGSWFRERVQCPGGEAEGAMWSSQSRCWVQAVSVSTRFPYI